jgi:hypothetical protein
MPGKQTDRTIRFIIEKYKRGAIVYFYGRLDESVPMQKAGCDSAKEALRALDALGARAREALIPLLEDPDPGIRVFAADDLLQIAPDKAILVLTAISNSEAWFPRLMALRIIDRLENGGSKT